MMAPPSYLSWIFWLTWATSIAVGWSFAGWTGTGIGFVLGLPTAYAFWGLAYYVAFASYLRRKRYELSELTTSELLVIAAGPESADLGFAIAELNRRGIVTMPSLGSIFRLLTSLNRNDVGKGMAFLHAIYPEVHARLPLGSSNLDSADVWRERILGLSEQDPRHSAESDDTAELQKP